MLYVSSFKDKMIGIKDTDDWVEEFVTESELVGVVRDKKLHIAGVKLWNNKPECSIITLDQTLDKQTLLGLLAAWKKVHNPWTGYPVVRYLASAKVGTKVTVRNIGSDGSTNISSIERLDYNTWLYNSTHSIADGERGDYEFAAYCLDIECLHYRVKSLTIG